MIEGLDDLLESKGQPGLQELRALVLELLGGPEASGRLIDEQKLLRSRVYRLRFEVDGDVRSVVAKRFSPDRARREQLVVRRWLPAVGMSQNGPPLLGTAADHQLRNHKRQTDQQDTDQVHDHKRAATVNAGDIGEFPDVTETYRRSGGRQDKPESGTPLDSRRTFRRGCGRGTGCRVIGHNFFSLTGV